MRPAQGLDEAVGHQGPGGNHRLEPAAIDHLADEQAHLGDAHGPGKGADHGAVGVAQHGLQHVGGLAQVPAAEGGLPHGPQQLVEILNLIEVQGLQRRQAVFGPVVKVFVFASHFRNLFSVLSVLLSSGFQAFGSNYFG